MNIIEKPFETLSENNKEVINKFATILRDLIELYGSSIPFSAFKRGGYEIIEIYSLLHKINSYKFVAKNNNIPMEEHWRGLSEPTPGYASSYLTSPIPTAYITFYSTYFIKPLELKEKLFLSLSPDAIKILNTIIEITQKTTPKSEKLIPNYDQSRSDNPNNTPGVTKITKQNKIVYEITYNTKNEIRINDILLSQPNLYGSNDLAFGYIVRNPNRLVTREEIKKFEKDYDNKPLTSVIKDLGFKGIIKELFFPAASKDAVKLINPITIDHLNKKEFKHLKKMDVKLSIENIRKGKILTNETNK